MTKSQLLICLLVVSNIVYSQAICYNCLPTANIACVSDTQYWACSGGSPVFGRLFSCNPGEVCSDTLTGCTRNTIAATQCNLCNKCNTANFACTGLDTYTTCTNGIASAVSVQCAPSFFCDATGTTTATICRTSSATFPICNVPNYLLTNKTTAAPTTTTVAPTTTTTVTTTTTATTTTTISTTTVNPTLNPVTYCTNISSGKYAVLDKTCTKYINCFNNGVSNTGVTYSCPGSTLFDATARTCTTPYTCLN